MGTVSGGTVSGAISERNGRKLLRPFLIAIVVASVLPFVFWPSLLVRISSADFMPHRACYLNTPDLIWANVIADSVIGISYVAISATLAYLVHSWRKDIPFSWMFLAFGLFIVSCGLTHFMEVLTVWRPYYWLAADVKIVTAVASAVTAVCLPSLVPRTAELILGAQAAASRRKQLEVDVSRMTRLEEMSAQLASRVSTGMAFWQWDVQTGVIRWWGDTKSVFGVAPEESDVLLTFDRFLSAMSEQDRERVRAAINNSLASGSEYDVEFRIKIQNQSMRWIMARGLTFYDPEGKPTVMVGVDMDVTARRLADEALQRSDKLAATGRLAATIAHEINNPLESVTNLSYLIAHDPDTPQNVKDLAELGLQELKRISRIVRNTLAFHRGSGASEVLSARSIVESALALYEAQLRRKKIRVDLDAPEVASVYGVASDLRQVFANLIGNAIDVLPDGGSLRVRVRNGSSVSKIDVVDNGPGIPQENIGRLFEPFFTTKGERGTGLGLWVSQGIITKHGGQITMRTRRGSAFHGTRFTVTLPAGNSAQ